MNVFGNVIMPIVTVILIVGVIMFMANKGSTGKDTHYDEMQLKIRATGYKLGFFVTLIGLYVFGFMIELIESFGKVISPSFCMMAAGFIGIVTFAVYCIIMDAFYSIGQNRKGYIFLCVLVILVNGIGTISHIIEGTLIEDGMVTFSNCGGLLGAAGFLVILISLLIKEVSGKKEVDE